MARLLKTAPLIVLGRHNKKKTKIQKQHNEACNKGKNKNDNMNTVVIMMMMMIIIIITINSSI